MSEAAVRVAELRKVFDVPEREAGLKAATKSLVRRRTKEVRAVDGISFEIAPGEIVGLGSFQTGRWPVGIYPDWLRFGITFLVPIAFAVTVPAEAITSRLDWPTLLLAVVFTTVLFAATRWFWRFGLKHYTGASA